MKKAAITLLIIIPVILTISSPTQAYKTDTHWLITQQAVLKSNNYASFVNEFNIDSLSAFSIIGLGAVREDDYALPVPRYFHHFYDPINGQGWLGYSNGLIWGYRYESALDKNDFSWSKARKFMFDSLTVENVTSRTENSNLMFRSLGQIIHLVEDMAQPSHVRNDPHASHNEDPSGVFPFLLNPSHLEDWAQFNGGYVAAFANTATGPKSAVSFDDPFETLALFSNQNFFSDDTIFKNYAQPSYGETNYEDSFLKFGMLGEPVAVVAEDGQIYYVPYIFKTQGVPGGYKLAQVGYFGSQLADNPGVRELAFQIDDEVARENAAILLPQAVAYSAGLLDYFFRGDLDAQADGKDGVKITNNSSEAMNGTFALYYDDNAGNRKQAPGASWDFALAPGATSDRQSFTQPTNAEEPGKYLLVFKGQLGSEGTPDSDTESAVVAENVTLSQVNYLFMIPEVVEFLSPPTEQLNYVPPDTCFYVVEGIGWQTKTIQQPSLSSFRIWDIGKQRISGRFVMQGSAYIKKISNASFGYPFKVYLDGVLIDPATWIGDPERPPKTWAIESQNYDPSSYGPGFSVQMSDGQSFGAPLLAYTSASASESRRESCMSEDGSLYDPLTQSQVPLKAGASAYVAKAGGGIEIGNVGYYTVLSMAGYAYDVSKGRYCDPPSSVLYPGLRTCFINQSPFRFSVEQASGLLLSDPGVVYFPKMPIGGEVRYTTPPVIVNRLKELGISPIDFTVILK